MHEKHLKINETVLVGMLLLVVSIPFLNFHYNKKIASDILQKHQNELQRKEAENEVFVAKYDQQKVDEATLNTYAQKYEIRGQVPFCVVFLCKNI